MKPKSSRNLPLKTKHRIIFNLWTIYSHKQNSVVDTCQTQVIQGSLYLKGWYLTQALLNSFYDNPSYNHIFILLYSMGYFFLHDTSILIFHTILFQKTTKNQKILKSGGNISYDRHYLQSRRNNNTPLLLVFKESATQLTVN